MSRLEKCPKCQCERIAKRLVVFEDSKNNYNSSFKAAMIGYLGDPDALVFKEKVASSFSAEACCHCGYLEFYLDSPLAFRDRVEEGTNLSGT